MKYAIFFVLALGLIAAGTSSSFPAASAVGDDPIYMKINGIDGDVTAIGHENEIQLNSFQFGASVAVSPITGGGASAGKVSLSEIVGTKMMDKSSPLLLQKLVTGAHIPQVDIYFVKTTGGGSLQTYAHYILQDVLISGYSVSSGGDLPTESLSLNFAKIQFEFTPTNPNGTPGTIIHAGWDLALLKAI